VSKDPAIFFPERGRPNAVLNKRLPGITARDVLSIGSEILHPLNGPTDLTCVETFPGAACLTRFAVMQRA
jgi:hypothetical protein